MLTAADMERTLDGPAAGTSGLRAQRRGAAELAPGIVLPVQLDHLTGRCVTPERRE